MIHPEVVLEGNSRKGLCSSLYGYIFLSLYRLVETITPATSFHNTSGLLIDNLHLAVHYNIVDVLLEHRISLQKLCNSMNSLTLERVIFHKTVLLLMLFSLRDIALFDISDHRTYVRQDEE